MYFLVHSFLPVYTSSSSLVKVFSSCTVTMYQGLSVLHLLLAFSASWWIGHPAPKFRFNTLESTFSDHSLEPAVTGQFPWEAGSDAEISM